LRDPDTTRYSEAMRTLKGELVWERKRLRRAAQR
jgi:hypothetical protein